MQRGLTWFLTVTAACLFALIYFFERQIPGTAERRAPKLLLPLGSAAAVQSVEVALRGEGLVRAERNADGWQLTEPAYPAKQAGLDAFAKHLAELRALDRIPASEAALQGLKTFGLDPARAAVELQSPGGTFRFEVGGIAPITSNVYLRLPRSGEVVLAEASLLDLLPRSRDDWRAPGLFELSGLDFDRIQIRAGQRAFELERTATNTVWRISKPVPARADQDRVLELLHVFRGAEASEFVTDTPGADLDRFGLQTPEVEVTFAQGARPIYKIEFGASPAARTNVVYARLLGRTNVVLAPRELAAFLKQPYKSFHDPRLLSLQAASLDRIIVSAREDFTLQRQPSGLWTMADKAKTPVDRELFAKFVSAVNSLQILDIVKEVPAEADLKALGFTPAANTYAFFEKLAAASGLTTNILFTDLHFGGARADTIHVRRSDEAPVYLTQLGVALELPKRAFELRDRALWRFPTNDLAGLALSTSAGTNLLRRGASGWSDDPIASAMIEEIVFRLSQLRAREWVEKGAARLAAFGITPASLRLTLDVRTPGHSRELLLQFGRPTLGRDAYAAVVFPGENDPSIFEFPGDLYQMILQALPLPGAPGP